MSVFVASVVIALAVSFLCSLMEATLLSLSPSQVAQLSMRNPQQGAIWQNFKGNIERPIAVILILNTTAHTVGASIAGAHFDKLFGTEWIWLFGALFTFVMLQYTEILPKTLGVRLAGKIAPAAGLPLMYAVRVLTPVIHAIHWLNRPFERGTRTGPATSTVDEITALAAMARYAKQISPQQENIITGAARLASTPVSRLMIPAEQIAFLSSNQLINEALIAAHIDSHPRFPVCRDGDRDQGMGYVNFKELVYFMKTNPADPSLNGITRPVRFVSPDTPTSELLRMLVEQHEHLAIVRDTAGRTLGLVTFEDAVEELVGEIDDELDRLPKHIHELSGGRWLAGGGVSMRDLSSKLGVTVVEDNGILASWLEKRVARPLRVSESISNGPFEYQIRRLRRGSAFELAITRKQGAAQTGGAA